MTVDCWIVLQGKVVVELKPPETAYLLAACPGRCGSALMLHKTAGNQQVGSATVPSYSLRIIEEVVSVIVWLSGLSARPENSLPLIS